MSVSHQTSVCWDSGHPARRRRAGGSAPPPGPVRHAGLRRHRGASPLDAGSRPAGRERDGLATARRETLSSQQLEGRPGDGVKDGTGLRSLLASAKQAAPTTLPPQSGQPVEKGSARPGSLSSGPAEGRSETPGWRVCGHSTTAGTGVCNTSPPSARMGKRTRRRRRLVGTMTGLRVWSRGVRAAPAALLAHIVVRQEPVACPDIPAALEPALTLAVSIAIAFARTTRPIISTVVHVPVLPAP